MHKEYTDQTGGLYSRHCADIENKPPESPQAGLCLLLKKGGGLIFIQEDMVLVILYSRKYWLELSLVVDSNRHCKLKY